MSSYHGKFSQSGKLMDTDSRGNKHTILAVDLAGQSRIVGHHNMVTQNTVVSYVGVGHQEVVVADLC